MTKVLRISAFVTVVALILLVQQNAMAQCAMCSATVESNAQGGTHETAGLNNGIMYLLAMPYIAVAIVGFIWYKKYRRKNVVLKMRDEKLNLN